MKPSRKILVTSALPYANGPIHLGHLVEYIQTDIWARWQRLQGNTCHYICASDAHGTPIMLRAQAEGVPPQALIDKVHAEHAHDFAAFGVKFDNFYTTHSPENERYSIEIYQRLRAAGLISEAEITQAYDAQKAMFLPDRFVKGTCPKCGAGDQYGDNCEVCGSTYSPKDLIDPKSVLSGETPIERPSLHYFFDLPQLADFLSHWLKTANIQREIQNKMQEWFEQGLQKWDISRDAPYWGFRIPDSEEKYFYVWLDAPIGYMASFANFAARQGFEAEPVWQKNSDVELYHFIGKDIAYFHTLFWPAMLQGAGYRTPTGVFCHGFLTVNGAKMSKSRGTFIQAATYLKTLEPEYLRYYYASKLNSGIEDLDLNLEDFRTKVNGDIVGKLVNLASRSAPFIHKQFLGRLATTLSSALFAEASGIIKDKIAPAFEQREYAQAIRLCMQLADKANAYIEQEKPWILAKQADIDSQQRLHQACSTSINLFYQLITVLQPVLPNLSEKAYQFLNVSYSEMSLQNAFTPLTDHLIQAFEPLASRVEESAIAQLFADSQSSLSSEPASKPADKVKIASDAAKTGADIAESSATTTETIQITDFAKLDLRVGVVLACEKVDGSDKLLRFQLDIGALGERQIFSGIQAYYPNPSELVGRKVVVLVNLAPRKMRFGVSEGMILSSSTGEQNIHLLAPDSEAQAGDTID